MLIQLHHQFEDHTEFVAQREIHTHEEMRRFVREIEKEYPLSKGAAWLSCTSVSRHFIKTHKS